MSHSATIHKPNTHTDMEPEVRGCCFKGTPDGTIGGRSIIPESNCRVMVRSKTWKPKMTCSWDKLHLPISLAQFPHAPANVSCSAPKRFHGARGRSGKSSASSATFRPAAKNIAQPPHVSWSSRNEPELCDFLAWKLPKPPVAFAKAQRGPKVFRCVSPKAPQLILG